MEEEQEDVRVVRTVNIDQHLYEQAGVVAGMMGISIGTLVEEATVYYVVNAHEKLLERVQERIDSIFEGLKALPYHNLPDVAGGPGG